MKAVFLSTGDEVLHGDIVDSNAAWLGQLLYENDLPLTCRVTLADDFNELRNEFVRLSHDFDLVIVNGGLGPTVDDLSAQAMAEACGVELVLDEEWLDILKTKYAKRNKSMPSSNIKQAMLPSGSSKIDNPVGTACGFYLKFNKAHFYFTPGVPSEFKLMAQAILPDIKQKLLVDGNFCRKRYHTFGLSESWLSDRLDELDWPQGITVGYRSAMPSIEIKLMSSAGQEPLAAAETLLLPHIQDFISSKGEESQAQYLVNKLTEGSLTLALAESCTGGLVAAEIVGVAGSSKVFPLGVVSYSNEAKQQQLNVPKSIIEQHGAVSIQVVEAMAKGVQALAKSDYALAISGIAGPDGGSDEKPVGTVAFALATPRGLISQVQLLPNRGRDFIRTMSVALALDMLRRSIQGLDVSTTYQFTRLIEYKTK